MMLYKNRHTTLTESPCGQFSHLGIKKFFKISLNSLVTPKWVFTRIEFSQELPPRLKNLNDKNIEKHCL